MGSYLASIWQCRYFWMSLVKMDLRTRYRRSMLGLGWSLLHPIAMTTVLCVVFSRIFNIDAPGYAASLMAGMAFWNFVTASAIQGCSCFVLGESYIRQHPSPLAIFPLRAALGSAIHFSIALVVVIGLAIFTVGLPDLLALLSLTPSLLLLFGLGWSLAILFGIANVLFQDTEHLATVGFQILFYATPIVYPEEQLRATNLMWLMKLNPLVPFLDLLREPIIRGNVPAVQTYALATLTLVIVGGVGTLVLNKMQRRLIFYL